jgi:mRNA interferase RelE/StbE
LYRVDFKNSAAGELRSLMRDVQLRGVAKLEKLKENPRAPGVKKMKGMGNLYRARVGDYRIQYSIDDATQMILVTKVSDRKDAY